MRPFVDPNLRPIDPPPFDDPSEPYLNEADIPKDCFEPNSSVHAEENLLDSGLNPVGKQALVTQQSHEKKESNKESDQEKTKNQLQNEREPALEAIVIDNKTVFSAEKILKHRKRSGKVTFTPNCACLFYYWPVHSIFNRQVRCFFMKLYYKLYAVSASNDKVSRQRKTS